MPLVVGNGATTEELSGNTLLIPVLKEATPGTEVPLEPVGTELELKVGNGGVMEEGPVGIEKIPVPEYVGAVDNPGALVEP